MTRSLAVETLLLLSANACTGADAVNPLTTHSSDASVPTEIPAVCRSTGYPDPPNSNGPAGSTEFVVARQTLNGGDSSDPDGAPSYRTIGFNLDRKCTGPLEGPGCVEPTWATADHDDGPEGQDNAFGGLVYSLDPTGHATAAGAQALENTGVFTLLIRVSGYNELSEDDQVEVSLFGATMQDHRTPGKLPAKGASWNGADEWKVLSPWLEGSTDGGPGVFSTDSRSTAIDPDAYVNGGVLVAHFPRLLLGGPFDAFIEYHLVVLAAEIQNDGGTWGLASGTLGGRVSEGEGLRLVGGVFAREPGESACTPVSNPTYLQIKLQLCANADIRSDDDDRAATCNGLSQAAAFRGVAARIGTIVEPANPAADTCPPGAGTDSCDTLR
jgi:hypothetical protein